MNAAALLVSLSLWGIAPVHDPGSAVEVPESPAGASVVPEPPPTTDASVPVAGEPPAEAAPEQPPPAVDPVVPPTAGADPDPTPLLAPVVFASGEPEPYEPPPPPPSVLHRGAYLEAGLGPAASMYGDMPIGLVVSLGAGFLFEGRVAPRLRVALGVRGSNLSRIGDDSFGFFAAEARFGVGYAGERALTMAHLGVGPGVAYGREVGTPELGPATSLAVSMRGPVGKRVALGAELGMMMDIAGLRPLVYGLLAATWTWEVPRKERGR